MLDSKQVERLEHILAVADEQFDQLSDWEQNFIADMKVRFEEYQEDTFVTRKQWDILERLMTKVER